jgi:hypothetical protein
MNVDEFEHTEVEQQARRAQLRVSAALARRDQQHVPATLHAKKDEPKLTTEVQMAVEPFSFPIDIPELGIELRVETGSSSHRMATSITVDRRDPEVQREGNDVTQAAFQSPTAHTVRTHGERRLVYVASVTADSPPTHPAQLHDGGGADVGGVGSHQTQDTGTETNSSTAS